MPDIRLEWENLDLSQRQLALLSVALQDLRPFWPRVTRLAISWISLNFETEGVFGLGHRWAPLSAEYLAWKTQHHPGKKILSATGALRRAATTPARITTPRELVLEIGPYENDGELLEPEWFQDGTENMPARPLLFDLTPIMEAQLLDEADDYANEILDALGL